MMTKIYVDGSGWNGERSGFCVYFDSGRCIEESFEENQSNNMMEYAAMFRALCECGQRDTIFSDSQLVVNQILKGWKCNYEHLRIMRDKCIAKMKEKNAMIVWIEREDNIAGRIIEKGINLNRLLRRVNRREKNGNATGHIEEEGRQEENVQGL